MVRLLIAIALLLPLAGGDAQGHAERRKGRCRICSCGGFAGPGIVCKRKACRHPEGFHKIR